jgi:hypothetical protein
LGDAEDASAGLSLHTLEHLKVECVDKVAGDRHIQLIELAQRGNVHVHSRCVVDEKYLEAGDNGTPKYNIFNLNLADAAARRSLLRASQPPVQELRGKRGGVGGVVMRDARGVTLVPSEVCLYRNTSALSAWLCVLAETRLRTASCVRICSTSAAPSSRGCRLP